MIQRRFENWEYHTIRQIEEGCLELPVLSRSHAVAFFKQAGDLLKQDLKAVERQRGSVFESLGGFIISSNRQDFMITTDFPVDSSLHGLLMLETFDDVLGVLFCVARVSENAFLTHGFTQRQKSAVKDLINSMPEGSPVAKAQAFAANNSASPMDRLCASALDLDATKEVREAAWKTLEEQGNTVLGFIAGLKHKDLEIRRAMAFNLGYVNDARALEPLLEALKNEDENIRWGAAESLGKLGKFADARIVAGLNVALADTDQSVRKAAAQALKVIAGPEA